jgi:hypothetical protein
MCRQRRKFKATGYMSMIHFRPLNPVGILTFIVIHGFSPVSPEPFSPVGPDMVLPFYHPVED